MLNGDAAGSTRSGKRCKNGACKAVREHASSPAGIARTVIERRRVYSSGTLVAHHEQMLVVRLDRP